MKPIIILFLISLTLSAKESTLTGKVVGVTDGDTITLLDGSNTQYKIRLYGIDTPEKNQAFGMKAKQALSTKVFAKSVKVIVTTKDRYGRYIGKIYLDNDYINLKMVQEGWAWHYKQYSKDKDLSDAEIKAKAGKLGLWKDSKPVPPWDWRRSGSKIVKKTFTTEGTGEYWLNTSSNSRHNSKCRWFKKTKAGRPCTKGEGKACGGCGG